MQHDRPNDLVADSVDSAHRRRQSFRWAAVRVIAVACVLTLPFLPLRADTVRADPSDPVRLRVLTLNLYGLRYPSKRGSTTDRSDCAGRFKAAAEQIRNADPPYDIVAIQELYSLADSGTIACDPAPFLGELGAAGSRGLQKILFLPRGGPGKAKQTEASHSSLRTSSSSRTASDSWEPARPSMQQGV